ncbi:MAG: hypothetical protein WBO00_03900 [Steroidobacteraceae bacterium]
MGNSGKWSEDVTVREIPDMRLVAAAWLVFVVVAAGMIAWELQMRSLGLVAGDLDDSKAHWAVERRKVAAGDYDDVVIIGSSRILFDTNLDIWNEISGRRPIQLAMPGTSPRPVLTHFAEDPDFKGLLLVDVAPEGFFIEGRVHPDFAGALDYWKEQSPSQRFGHQAGLFLSRHLAFLDDQYTLTTLIDQLDLPNRGEITRPYLAVWKLSESYDDRQTMLWSQIETNQRLRRHAMQVWMSAKPKPPDAALLAKIFEQARRDVGKIRARGGEVVFVRPPSMGFYHEREERNFPRAKTWDRLLQETGAFGINFEDYPEMQGLEIPEMSHLSRESATRFTRAYVGVIMRDVPWLGSHVSPRPSRRRP